MMQNDGSGATGNLQARAGDVTCLHIANTSLITGQIEYPVWTDGARIRNTGYGAIEADVANGPINLVMGAWHDTPALGEVGKVQCSGWDADVLVDIDATFGGPGTEAPATLEEPHLTEPATPVAVTEDGRSIIVEPTANVDGTNGADIQGTAANIAVYWRCL
jgi:hypothetical protein